MVLFPLHGQSISTFPDFLTNAKFASVEWSRDGETRSLTFIPSVWRAKEETTILNGFRFNLATIFLLSDFTYLTSELPPYSSASFSTFYNCLFSERRMAPPVALPGVSCFGRFYPESLPSSARVFGLSLIGIQNLEVLAGSSSL